MARVNQTLMCLLDSWQWVEIFLCAGIKTAEVYAKAQGPILLLNQYYSVTPHTLTRANHVQV